VADVLEKPGRLQRVSILLLLQAFLVRLGGVARLGTSDRLRVVDARAARRASAGCREEERSTDRQSHRRLPIRPPAPSPPPMTGAPSRAGPAAPAVSPACPPAAVPASRLATLFRPAVLPQLPALPLPPLHASRARGCRRPRAS